ncbi:MAG: Na+/H+ antiporter NhaA [Proteobacteria bacterium]|nr:Na+/H+ antiporter NhaA [Pseudomonadota bacterium]
MNRLWRRARGPLTDFLRLEAAAGACLVLATLAALALANSPAQGRYQALLAWPVGGHALLGWVNDGLMTLFFLLVGLEIKREFLAGELRTRRRAALPAIAALGGMLVPALLYLAVVRGEPALARGWGVPTATDIAFALGVLALLGPRVPRSLKVFLTALATLDDLGAIVLIGVYYAAAPSWPVLAGALGAFAVLLILNRRGVTRLAPYLAVGAVLWALVLASGVHATLAGVALAATIPLGEVGEAGPLRRLEHALHPWVAFLVLPLFALANAGLPFGGASGAGVLPLAIATGLLVGKPLGVLGATALAVRLGIAEPPAGSTGLERLGVALLCGIGFTMSLFIGGLAFEAPGRGDAVRLGVLGGSLAAALLGLAVLVLAARRRDRRGAG